MELFSALASIVIIDLVLSGDNAVVIGMAAHSLPERQRKLAIVIGGAAAVALRVASTGVASMLLLIPVLKLVGGLLLIWIAFSLLEEEEEDHERTKLASSFRTAIQTILMADFVMSLDNVLAVAGAAHGDVPLLIFGLALSMPIIMFSGSIVAALIDRLWWLAYVGSGVIAWTGAAMVIEDESLHSAIAGLDFLKLAFPALTLVVVVASSHWFHRRPGRAINPKTNVIQAMPDACSEETAE